jgi:glycopeptide antibiotics resistance protein
VIELIQLVFRLGLFEVDDVINNTLGAVIGLVNYIIFMRGKNEHNKQKIS